MSECCANCLHRIRENGIDYCTLYRHDWQETTLDDYCGRWIYDELNDYCGRWIYDESEE